MKIDLLPLDGNVYKTNLHCHTKEYDSGAGFTTPLQIKELYKSHGYNIIAFTGYNKLTYMDNLNDDEFMALPGFEAMLADDKTLKIYHFNCFPKYFGVKQDYAEAMTWYRKAADQGLALAQFALGAIYGVGQGVEKNDAEAVEWMRKAATQGYFTAQLSLGVRYADGNGVPRDLVEGFTWLSLGAQGLVVERQHRSQSEMKAEDLMAAQAASRPFEDAALQLFERLKTELTPEQIAEAQKRIAAFAEKTKDQP